MSSREVCYTFFHQRAIFILCTFWCQRRRRQNASSCNSYVFFCGVCFNSQPKPQPPSPPAPADRKWEVKNAKHDGRTVENWRLLEPHCFPAVLSTHHRRCRGCSAFVLEQSVGGSTHTKNKGKERKTLNSGWRWNEFNYRLEYGKSSSGRSMSRAFNVA